jgi:hypothetical protein
LFARLQDRLVDAETSARAALAVSETLSSGVTLRALARADLGLALLEKGELDEAERALQTSRLELEEAQGGVTPDRLDVELGLARISYLRGRKPELMPSLDPAAQSWPASGAQTLDGHAFEYWRAKVNGVSPAVPTLAALRSSPYPLHRKWLAN